MNTSIVIIGAGGHGRVLLDALKAQNMKVLGIVETDPKLLGSVIMEVEVSSENEMPHRFPPESVRLVNGIGSVQTTASRREIFERFKAQGYSFATVLHPTAIIAREVELAEGVQVMAAAVIQTGVNIGQNTIVNTSSIVDHDCLIGSHVHISPGVTLSGLVRVASDVHIGTGSTVIQGIEIGEGALVAAGAVVVRNIGRAGRVAGVPAKEMGW